MLCSFLTLVLWFAGCKKLITEEIVLNGKYTGTFQRTQGIGTDEAANVSISFTPNTFTGISDRPKYPAICNGTYSVSGNQITFNNDCMWTADFDWTLILSKTYSVKVTGDSLQLRRDNADKTTDLYRLKKE